MNLTDRAMLVELNISQWAASRNDKKITREVAEKHNSDASMGRYTKQLLSKEALEKIKKAASAARQEHYKRTLPWSDNGSRILTSAGYLEYSAEMRKLESEFYAAVQEFITGYDQFVADARVRLNGLFQDEDYPSKSVMRSKFNLGFNVYPVPQAEDFRVDLGSAETARIQADIEAAANSRIESAMRDAWTRVHDVVAHMAERLRAYQVTADGTANPFRDSLVTNIVELLDILPTLNLTNNADLDTIANQIRASLTQYSAEELRTSDWKRNDTAARAEEILGKMAAFIA